MAHILVLLDSAKQGHWRFLLNVSVQESDCSSCPRLLTMFSPGPLLAPVNTGHGWSMRRKHACLFLLFTPFLSELTEDKCVTVEVINVHFQDMIYWHFLSERRQTFVSFRTSSGIQCYAPQPSKMMATWDILFLWVVFSTQRQRLDCW